MRLTGETKVLKRAKYEAEIKLAIHEIRQRFGASRTEEYPVRLYLQSREGTVTRVVMASCEDTSVCVDELERWLIFIHKSLDEDFMLDVFASKESQVFVILKEIGF